MSNGALEQTNMTLMKTLDDAWNSQDWDAFSKRHVDDVGVRWPAQPPTNDSDAHKKEAEYFFSAFQTIMSVTTHTKYSLLRENGLVLLEFTGTY